MGFSVILDIFIAVLALSILSYVNMGNINFEYLFIIYFAAFWCNSILLIALEILFLALSIYFFHKSVKVANNIKLIVTANCFLLGFLIVPALTNMNCFPT